MKADTVVDLRALPLNGSNSGSCNIKVHNEVINMKRILSAFLCISLLLSDYSDAEAVALPVAATAAATAIVTVGGAYYYLQSGGTTTFDGQKFIRSAAVSYAVINAVTRVPEVVSKTLTASLPPESVTTIVDSSPTNYPLLHASRSGIPSVSGISNSTFNSLTVGSIIRDSSGSLRTVKRVWSSGWNTWVSPNPRTQWDGGYQQYVMSYGSGSHPQNSEGYYSSGYHVAWSPFDPPPPQPAPAAPTPYAWSIAPSGAVKPEYQAEMDKAFRDPAYIPSFSDTTTGLPWSPPADVVTIPEATAAEKAIAARAASQSAVDAAAQASTSARSAADAAVAAAAANPTDADAQRRAAYYVSIADQRDADLARTQSDAATLDATQAKDAADSEVPAVDSVARKVLDWEKWKNLKNSMSNVWPFTLLSSLSGLLSQFAGDPVAPSFDLPVYGTTKLHIDLSIFDPIAAITRWAIGILMTIGIVQLLVNWYRGTS